MDKDLKKKVQQLGAELRHNLNNPLQEITAMTSVVQLQSSASKRLNTSPENDDTKNSDTQNDYLHTIQSAAKSMAKIISGLEERLLLAVNEAENEDDERAESSAPSYQNGE